MEFATIAKCLTYRTQVNGTFHKQPISRNWNVAYFGANKIYRQLCIFVVRPMGVLRSKTGESSGCAVNHLSAHHYPHKLNGFAAKYFSIQLLHWTWWSYWPYCQWQPKTGSLWSSIRQFCTEKEKAIRAISAFLAYLTSKYFCKRGCL